MGQGREWIGTTPIVPTVAATTTWDPATKHADVTLSGGNLIAAAVSDDKTTKSVASMASGKFYWETKWTAGGWLSVGIANSAASNAAWIGSTLNGLAWFSSDGTINTNGSPLTSINTYADEDWVGIAVDVTAELFWGKNITAAGNWNNNGSANPATGVGGISFASMNAGPWFAGVDIGWGSVSGPHATGNFGGSAYVGTPPSGFGNL